MDYKKPYIRAVLWCVIPTVLTVVVNVLCLVFRTDENHTRMLAINVLTDWLCGIYLVYFISCKVSPQKELYRLSRRRREEIRGLIDKIDPQPVRYERLTCVVVHIGQRQLFAPEGMTIPQPGDAAVFHVVSNVILEVD